MVDVGTARWRTGMRMALPVLILITSVIIFFLLLEFIKSEPVTAKESITVPKVRTAEVQQHQSGMTIEADGVVTPYREIDLAAEVFGRIVEQSEICRPGNFVSTGTLLVRIDPRDYELEEERLERELQQANVSLEELTEEMAGVGNLIELAEQEVSLRQRELKRQQDLANVVTSTDVERAEANELASRNALLTLQNRLRLLRISQGRLEGARDLTASKLEKARLELERTQIVAPVDGVIVKTTVEQDSYVQKGTPLLTIEDTSKVEVKCKLEMEQLYWLWDQQRPSVNGSITSTVGRAYHIPTTDVKVIYRLSGQDEREYVWDGRLARFDGIGLDTKTRTIACRVVVDHPQQRVDEPWSNRSGPPALVRGMYVAIRMQINPRTALLRIPEQAVQPGEAEGKVVWRVRDGQLAIVPVQFVTLIDPSERQDSLTREALIYVTDSAVLTARDQVVISPMASVRSGMDVEVSRVEQRD